MIRMRGYQTDFNAGVQAAWAGARSVLGVVPTGGGKTVCFASLMHDHTGACAAVVHRKEIVGQISQALARLGVKHRIVGPPAVVTRARRKHLKEFGQSFVDPSAQAGVVSVQTLTGRASQRDVALGRWLTQVTLGVFDEGHHYVRQGFWAKGVEALPNARLLFVTATPERADGKGLGAHADGFAEVMIEGPTAAWLIEQGYLCPFKYYAPDTDLDVAGVALTKGGELNAKALRARVVESHLVGDAVRHYQKFAAGKRAIVFATDVKTAEEIAAAFTAAGIAAASLSGETDDGVRDRTLDEFERGELLVLVNVDLFDEGFDVPGVDAVLMARPTESLAKFLQMVGRALRLIYADGFDLDTAEGRRAAIAASSKPHALVIDMVRNWERHGMPNWPRRWTLDGREKNSRATSDTIPQRVCVGCTQPYEAYHIGCPYQSTPECAKPPEYADRSAPDKVEGDLTQLDVDGMARLFAALNAAGMDDDEFTRSQIARGVPPVGRPRELRAHRAGKHRRAVLKELVAWWVGMQPTGRELAEVHRRFFYRFGIDIGSAFTLKAAETDALIERVTQRFAEDMV